MSTQAWMLNAESVGVEQSVKSGFEMTGVLPDEDRFPDAPSRSKDTYVIPSPVDSGDNDTDGGGLFRLYPWFNSDGRHVFVNKAHIITADSSTGWNILLTTGLEDGDATTIDDPARDITLANGSGDQLVDVNRELLRSQNIRVTTNAAVSAVFRVILHVSLTYSAGGVRG